MIGNMNWQEEFIYWLKYNDYWQKYIEAIGMAEKNVVDHLEDKYPASFLAGIFWGDYEFWYGIHLEWINYIKYWGEDEN